MKSRVQRKRDLVERLDAYIDRLGAEPKVEGLEDSGSDAQASALVDDGDDDMAQPMLLADLLSREAENTHVDPAFVETLSHRLHARHTSLRSVTPASTSAGSSPLSRLKRLAIKAERRTPLMRLTWGMTIVLAVVATLGAVLLLQPRALPAERILARAATAGSREAGSVVHTVVETRLHIKDPDSIVEDYGYISEDWRRIGAALDNSLVTIEHVSVHYPITDVQRAHPLSWSYQTWSERCFRDLQLGPQHNLASDATEESCVTLDQAVELALPAPFGQAAEADPQTWISRLQVNADDLQKHKDSFQGQPVYRLVESQDNTTLTLYIDRQDYISVAFVADTLSFRLIQIVHTQEVLSPASLPFDPFIWPPQTLSDPDTQTGPPPAHP